ncbi:MAG: TonB-dependent receptor [Gemmatimonadota bacterium]
MENPTTIRRLFNDLYPPALRAGTPAPLILVDGAITAQADLARIDRLDIDHIEIIKGGLAVGRYGEAARGGVIRITTKE